MKKVLLFLMCCAMLGTVCSCGSSSSTADTSAAQTTAATEAPPEPDLYAEKKAACELDDSNLDTYISNTVIATGNNYMIDKATSITYRAYFPAEQYGELEYCFYFSNTVDSTYGKGNKAYVGQAGGEYTIESAFISDGGTSVDDEISNKTAVTFGGAEGKDVASGEAFWSDPVTMNIPDGHFIVWEWTITGENIPCIQMSNLTSSTMDKSGKGNFAYCDQIPLPQLIGAKRDAKTKIVAIGDSITQGCQTEFMAYEFWSAQIANALGQDYSFWNCGLGYSRASDAAECGNWLARAKTADTVIVAFGTNDIVSGEYNGDGGNTAQEINDYISVILDVLKSADCKVIVFNAPPQDYNEENEAVRLELNELLKTTASEYGAEYFDFAACLSDASNPAGAKYGGHPNGEGGQVVADAFIEQFSAYL